MDRKCMLFAAALVLYLLLLQHIVIAATEDDTEWLAASEFTLYWGDQVQKDGYTITAQDFSTSRPADMPDDYVMLSIKSNTSHSWSAILALNNSIIPNETILDGLIKLTAKNIVTGNNIPTPYATIEVAIAKNTPANIMKPWINTVLRVKRNPSNEVYIDERAYILIELNNLMDIPLEKIHVNETVPDGFITDPDTNDTNWTINLRPGEKKIISYSMRALKPGNFTIPGMELSVEHKGITHSMQTNATEIVVHGPYIDMNKSFSYQDMGTEELLNVTLLVNNTGDRAAYVQLIDQMPEGCQLITGNLSKSQVMQPSDTWNIKYSMLIDSTGNIVIPGAKIRFVDSKGYSDTFESAKQILKIDGNVLEETLPKEDILQETKETDEKLEETVNEEKKSPEKTGSLNDFRQSVINLVERAIGWRL